MLKLAALAFLPVATVLFAALILPIVSFPEATRHFAQGSWLMFGAAALSLLLSVPIAYLVARRMLTRRELRLLDAGAGTGNRGGAS